MCIKRGHFKIFCCDTGGEKLTGSFVKGKKCGNDNNVCTHNGCNNMHINNNSSISWSENKRGGGNAKRKGAT